MGQNYNIFNCNNTKRVTMSSPFNTKCMLYLTSVLILSYMKIVLATNFYRDFNILWGNERGNILNNGKVLTLSLDEYSGSGIESKSAYLFSRIDVQIKHIKGNSAGTVTAFYVCHCKTILLMRSHVGNP